MTVPAHWIVGQLLDLKRYSDGSFRATLLGEEPKDGQMSFSSAWDAQEFVSHWYARTLAPTESP